MSRKGPVLRQCLGSDSWDVDWLLACLSTWGSQGGLLRKPGGFHSLPHGWGEGALG